MRTHGRPSSRLLFILGRIRRNHQPLFLAALPIRHYVFLPSQEIQLPIRRVIAEPARSRASPFLSFPLLAVP